MCLFWNSGCSSYLKVSLELIYSRGCSSSTCDDLGLWGDDGRGSVLEGGGSHWYENWRLSYLNKNFSKDPNVLFGMLFLLSRCNNVFNLFLLSFKDSEFPLSPDKSLNGSRCDNLTSHQINGIFSLIPTLWI